MLPKIQRQASLAGALIAAFALAAITFMLMPAHVTAQTPNPLVVYESQIAAYNAGDFEAGFAVFAPDVVGEGSNVCGGPGTCDPLPILRNAIGQGAWDGATFVIVEGSTTVDGNRVTGKLQNFLPAVFSQIGFERTQVTFTTEVNDDGLISFWSIVPDLTDPETQAVLDAFAAFAAMPEPETISAPEPEAISAPSELPNAGTGGLATDKGSVSRNAFGLASGLAGLVLLGSMSARLALKRRR